MKLEVLSSDVSTMLAKQFLSLYSTDEMLSDIFEGFTIIELLFNAKLSPITESSLINVSKVTDESIVVKVNEKLDVKFSKTEIYETIPKNKSFSWINYDDKVTVFLINFKRASYILTNIKTVNVPNPKIFVIETIYCLSNIHKECRKLLHYARKKVKEMLEENEKIIVIKNEFINHDLERGKTFAAKLTILYIT